MLEVMNLHEVVTAEAILQESKRRGGFRLDRDIRCSEPDRPL